MSSITYYMQSLPINSVSHTSPNKLLWLTHKTPDAKQIKEFLVANNLVWREVYATGENNDILGYILTNNKYYNFLSKFSLSLKL